MFKKTVANRLGYTRFKERVLYRRVPKTLWFQGDGAALTTLLLIQVVTGVTMTLYYSNSADFSYDSIRYLTSELPLGWLVRGIHYWGAGIMVVTITFHVLRHLALGGYKAPREGTWIIGVLQFFLVLTMSFSGYVLRWDERAVYAARVVLNMFYNVPVIGDELVLLVQGAEQMGSLTLTRFFSVHVWIVPLLLIALVGIHLYLVVLQGVSSKAEQRASVRTAEEERKAYKEAAHSQEDGEWFYPKTVLKTGTTAFVIFSIVFALALTAGPREMFPEGNFISASMPQEEWWFWWYSSLIAQLPPWLAPVFYWMFPLTLFVVMLLLPFIDRGANRGPHRRPFAVVCVVLIIVALLWLSYMRTKSPWTGWPDPNPPALPPETVISEEAERGRELFAAYGCNSCHAVASEGRRVGPDLARIKHRMSVQELRRFILKPPEDVPMPAYQSRISATDLDHIADFVLVAQTFPRRYNN